jgi:hypothetical protein
MGFWIGMLYGACLGINPIVLGFYSSAICWFADNILDLIMTYKED